MISPPSKERKAMAMAPSVVVVVAQFFLPLFATFLVICSASPGNESLSAELPMTSLPLRPNGFPIHGGVFATLLSAEQHFRNFTETFGKKYVSVEERAHRFSVFRQNLVRAMWHQALDRHASHGINKFSDLTSDEFQARYLGLKRRTPPRWLPPTFPDKTSSNNVDMDLPLDFDWREKGAITQVKDQGQCGCCWSFSTTGVVEGAHFIKTGNLVSLSEQQLVDCDRECDKDDPDDCDSGCDGGYMTSAYEYIKKAGGLQTESDYPYLGVNGQCNFNKSKAVATVEEFSVVNSDEDQIASNLVRNGPLAIGINMASMQTYIGGVSCPFFCNRHKINHAALLVGYGKSGYAPLRFKNKPYWIIKNSWGSDWGEEGYFRLCRGYNECGINTMVSTLASPSSI